MGDCGDHIHRYNGHTNSFAMGGGQMSERPRLTISVPCPTCGGTRVVLFRGIKGMENPCDDCTDGMVQKPVNCAGCKWFYRYGQKDITPDVWGMCLYDEGDSTDPWIVDVSEDHGCLSWEAKE